MLAALSLTAMCAACAAAPVKPGPVSLPVLPDWCAPVAYPALREGQDARAALARTWAALGQANGRLEQCAGWYGDVRNGFGGETK